MKFDASSKILLLKFLETTEKMETKWATLNQGNPPKAMHPALTSGKGATITSSNKIPEQQ
jgi:hypothetical protein